MWWAGGVRGDCLVLGHSVTHSMQVSVIDTSITFFLLSSPSHHDSHPNLINFNQTFHFPLLPNRTTDSSSLLLVLLRSKEEEEEDKEHLSTHPILLPRKSPTTTHPPIHPPIHHSQLPSDSLLSWRHSRKKYYTTNSINTLNSNPTTLSRSPFRFPPSMATKSSDPIFTTRHHHHHHPSDDSPTSAATTTLFPSITRTRCFNLPCFTSSSSSTHPNPAALHSPPAASAAAPRPSLWQRIRSAETDGRWWAVLPITALKKLREWSEIACGPKWKTFIRRFSKKTAGAGCCPGGVIGGGGSGMRHGNFRYDALSYSLNFDEGRRGVGDVGGGGGGDGLSSSSSSWSYPDFTSRYVVVAGGGGGQHVDKSSVENGSGGGGGGGLSR